MRFFEKVALRLAVAFALIGGLALVLLTLITVLSITGRSLVWAGLGPVPGDFELVEAGTGFAVFAFLAWCHFNREHAEVEILTMRFSPVANRVIDLVVDALMLVVACVLAYQHYLGMLDKIAYQETSFILRFPIWWAYAASLLGAIAFVIVAVYCLLASIMALSTGEPRKFERSIS
jgi:TRAP-type C4-dicarboxylate transport system permease small subunit